MRTLVEIYNEAYPYDAFVWDAGEASDSAHKYVKMPIENGRLEAGSDEE